MRAAKCSICPAPATLSVAFPNGTTWLRCRAHRPAAPDVVARPLDPHWTYADLAYATDAERRRADRLEDRARNSRRF